MFRMRLLCVTAGFATAFMTSAALTVRAQVPRGRPPAAPKQEAAAAKDQSGQEDSSDRNQNNRRGPWNDPTARLIRLRMQAAGIGGFRGGPGGGSSDMATSLLRNDAVQAELKLTDKQKLALTKTNETMDQRRRDLFRQMSRNGGGRGGPGGPGGGGFGPGGGGFGPGGGGFNNREAIQAEMVALREQSEQAIGQILSTAQKKRLKQIELQLAGPLGVAKPEVANAIGLSPMQNEQIQMVIEQFRTAQGDLMRQTFRRGGDNNNNNNNNNNGGPGGPGGPRGRGPRTTGNATTKNQGPAATPPDGGRPSPEEMASRFQTMNEQQMKLLAAAEAKVAKILNTRQKSAYQKLQGPKVDIMKIAQSDSGFSRGGSSRDDNSGRNSRRSGRGN
ncbi:MAG: hypothetical protein IRY99_19785 [Isosphaeraceae bacterium]|nr:hypothetical protein [Isosphaeraceae bacterium]